MIRTSISSFREPEAYMEARADFLKEIQWIGSQSLFLFLLLFCWTTQAIADIGQAPAMEYKLEENSIPASLPILLLAESNKISVSYEADDTDFLNPERGFHGNVDILNESDLSWIRNQGHALARSYIRLDAYRDQALPDLFLSQLGESLSNARKAGIKIVLRFAYNFGIGEPDASFDYVISHIQQLKPVLVEYQDVITILQAGFIGAWGEWHNSTNDLDLPENKAKILEALLKALPASRMVQIRYPGDLIDTYAKPLSKVDAYSGNDQARIGHHNDCFLANKYDAGTYSPPDRQEEFQTYLTQMSKYAPTGGETCQVTPSEHRSDCVTTLAELTRFHWSYLNYDFYKPDIDRWKAEGCFEEISKRLGYRYQLLNSSSDQRGRPGKPLSLTLNVSNIGFAGLYNARPAELILRNKDTTAEYKILIDNDIRFLLPEPNSTTNLPFTALLPMSITAGNYKLLLNLPDASASLSGRPEYSIRLANKGMWEAKSGYNDLGIQIVVE